jgi:hypothetical protein
VSIADLGFQPRQPIRVRIGVRPDAANVGGVNLFGRRFGHYPQDLVLRLEYTTPPRADDREDQQPQQSPEAQGPLTA